MNDLERFRPADDGRVFFRRVTLLDEAGLRIEAYVEDRAYGVIEDDARLLGDDPRARLSPIVCRALRRYYSASSRIRAMRTRSSSRAST